jgi:hypothetical protein
MLLPPAEKLIQQSLLVANVCTTTTGRLFITDPVSKLRFLIDTGSDLCVFPRKLIPWRRERVNYDLFAANGSTIPTYGWIPVSFNLCLRRDFTWRFVVADVQAPIAGVDLLSHFGLLLDGVTSLSVPAQPARTSVPRIKIISGGTPVDNLLAEFPELTRPTGIQREVWHNTVHNVRTTPDPQ